MTKNWNGLVYILYGISIQNALKEYIDVHIAEWIKRGYENTMDRYDVRGAPRPPWTYDTDFHSRHKALLLKKEIDRKEKPWYINKPMFVEAFKNKTILEYFWPYTPKTSAGLCDSSERYKNGFCLSLT